MWTLLILGIIGFVIVSVIKFIELHWYYDSFFETLLNCIVSCCAGLFGFCIGAIIGLIIALSLPAEMETKTIETKIVCLQDNNSVSGASFLGCGTVDGKMVYTYYIYEKNSDGFKLNQLDAEGVTIKYTNSEPKIVEYKTVNKDPKDAFINNFAVDDETSVYEIYVPKGSILNNYNLDAQ